MPRHAKHPRPVRPVLENYLARYRERANLPTQFALAELTGISQELLSKYESRSQPIQPDKLFVLAAALGLDHPLMIYRNPDEPDLNLLVADLTPADREEVIGLIEMKRRRRKSESEMALRGERSG